MRTRRSMLDYSEQSHMTALVYIKRGVQYRSLEGNYSVWPCSESHRSSNRKLQRCRRRSARVCRNADAVGGGVPLPPTSASSRVVVSIDPGFAAAVARTSISGVARDDTAGTVVAERRPPFTRP